MRDIYTFNKITQKCRQFFQDRLGFIEVPAQARLSILAACEDPANIVPFSWNKTLYPLPQTGQMWLEIELLKNPRAPGVFCITTSYRNEPNPIPGRHVPVFPMIEFEAAGTIEDLRKLEARLLDHLGFDIPQYLEYEKMCERYQTKELSAEHELLMQQEYGNSISLEYFPQRTSPFWNMKYRGNGLFNKIDVLLHGMETIGSAERETNVDIMRQNFLSISNGQYAKLLFDQFGNERVMKELDEYLSLNFFPRFGAGIGVTRLARAMELAGLTQPQAALSEAA